MTTPYAESVLRQLMEAGRRQQRTRRRRIGSAVAAAVAAVTGSAVLLLPSPAGADVRISVDGGFVEVQLTDRDTTPEDVVDAFEDKGLTVTVQAGPTGPSDVGRFIAVEMLNGDARQVELSASDGSFDHFRVRDGWNGDLRVTIGREARPGEEYLHVTDSFAEGEPLHCAGVHGRPLADVTDQLGRFEVRVSLGPIGGPGGQTDLAHAVAQHPDWVVTASWSISAEVLVITVEPVEPRADRC